MRKILLVLLVLVNILGFTDLKLLAASEKLELSTTEAKLTIDKKGNLKIFQNKGQIIQINTPIDNLWKVVLKNSLNNREFQFTADKNYTITRSDNILNLSVNAFWVEAKKIPLLERFIVFEPCKAS